MIGSDEISSNNMDLSETFRPEDLSKTDFFDFVTAPDIGINIGVNEHNNDRSSVTNDGNNSANTSTLQSYDQFWSSEKTDENRLESEIFGDIDRYCWQQQQSDHQQLLTESNTSVSPSLNTTNSNSTINHLVENNQIKGNSNTCINNDNSNTNTNDTNTLIHPTTDRNLSSNNVNIDVNASDGHVYTLTVLNGNEPWLKRPDTIITDAHLAPTLDLDSLLGTFPPYIKSEFIYEESGFCSTDASSSGCGSGNGSNNNDSNHCKIITDIKRTLSNTTTTTNQTAQIRENSNLINIKINNNNNNNHDNNNSNNDNTSLIGSTKLLNSLPSITIQTTTSNTSMTDFQNNNNDWQMIDNNSVAEQNSAESLLRSALQGKGYSKGLSVQNGISLMPPSAIKEEDLTDVLFTDETDSLPFADSTLANSIFEETPTQSVATSSTSTGNINNQINESHHHHHHHNNSSLSTGIILDDMFLSLDPTFTEDFEKIKKIASEVQQFVTGNDYSTEIIMEVAAAAAAASSNISQNACNNNSIDSVGSLGNGNPIQIIHQQSSLLPRIQNSQPNLNNDITSQTNTITTAAISSTKNQMKKYKRTSSIITSNNNSNCNDKNLNINPPTNGNNNNNNNINSNNNSNNNNINSNNNNNNNSNTKNNNNLNQNNANSSNNNSRTSPTQCNGQRKERSLHYCSICSKGFKDKYSVNVHIRTHTGEKPFSCTLCGKSFRQKAHLAKHYQTHLAQKNNGGIVKNAKNSNTNRINTSSQSLSNNNNNNNNINSLNNNSNNNNNNNINSLTANNSTGSLIKARQIDSITLTSNSNNNNNNNNNNNDNNIMSITDPINNNNIPNSLTININSVPLQSLPPATGILANR